MNVRRSVPWVLAAGFALTIAVLLGSAWFSVQALDAAETQTESLLARHRLGTHLIDEIQGAKAGVSGVFYAWVAGPRPVDRNALLAKLDQIESRLKEAMEAAASEGPTTQWTAARAALERCIGETRTFLRSDSEAIPSTLYRAHETLANSLEELVASNYQTTVEQARSDSSGHRRQLTRALLLLVVGLFLAVLCAIGTVRVADRIFRRSEWQARELSRLSGHVLDTQEQMLHKFSRELHDEFGQSLTAIEANLAAVPADSPEVASRIEDCSLLVKDLMSNIREFSQLLRPSALDDFGLTPCLQWLTESFSTRTSVQVVCNIEFAGRLPGEIETHLYRIAQEALTNVARHSNATEVKLDLVEREGVVRLSITDNGSGMRDKPKAERGGLGLAGMRERMRVSGGRLEIQSGPRGVTVVAEVSLNEAYPSLVGG